MYEKYKTEDLIFCLNNILCRCKEEERDGEVDALNAVIDVIENLPQPVLNVNGKSVECFTHKEWFAKIEEEVLEAHAEAINGDYDAFASELTDVITVCTSYLYVLGYDLEERTLKQHIVNDKNKRRGYFAKSQDKQETLSQQDVDRLALEAAK